MKSLVKIKTEKDGTQKVMSAKEMYSKMGLVEAHYKRWVVRNIEKNVYAIEGKDWVSFHPNGENLKGGRPTKDYVLSMDFAKKLCMQARTEQGEKIRDYFLECERVAKEKQTRPKTATYLPNESECKPLAIKAYAYISKVQLSSGEIIALGRKAMTLCRERGLFVQKEIDQRHGYEIGLYPMEVLREVFTDFTALRLA